jgi:hypothetical protein
MPFNKRYHSIAVGQWLFENAQFIGAARINWRQSRIAGAQRKWLMG